MLLCNLHFIKTRLDLQPGARLRVFILIYLSIFPGILHLSLAGSSDLVGRLCYLMSESINYAGVNFNQRDTEMISVKLFSDVVAIIFLYFFLTQMKLTCDCD